MRRLREEGLRGLVLRFLRWLGVYRRFVLAGGPDEDRATPAELPVDCARLGLDSIDEYLAFRPDQPPEWIRARLERGDWCLVGRCDGRIVVAMWIAFGEAWLEFLSARIALAEGAFYLHDLFVLPEYRRKRVAQPLMAFRMAALREAGYDRKVILYEPENFAADRRSLRHGNTELAWLTCLQLGPWRRLRMRPADEKAERLVWLAQD